MLTLRRSARLRPHLVSLALVSIVLAGCADARADDHEAGVGPFSAATEAPVQEQRVEALLEYRRGRQAGESGDTAAKVRHLSRAVALDPASPNLRMAAGWACWLTGDFEAAASHYAAVQGTTRARAQVWRAHSLMASGDLDAAREVYQRAALESVPVIWGPVFLPGENDKGAEARVVLHWSREARARPESDLTHWMHGNALENVERYSEAILAYERTLELSPEFVPAQGSLALALLKAKMTDRAAAVVAELAAVHPTSPMVNCTGFLVEVERGEHAAAIAYLRQYSAAAGRLADIGFLITGAKVALNSGQSAAGVEFLNAALLPRGTHPRAIFYVGDVDTLRRLVGRDPRTPLERYALASALYGCVYDKVLGRSSVPSYELGPLLEQVGPPTAADRREFGEGSDASRAVCRLADPNWANPDFVALDLPYLGRAFREAEAAFTEDPSFTAAKVLLSELYHFVGREDLAGALQREVLRDSPGATAIRLRYSKRVPLDRAFELLDELDERDAAELGALSRRAILHHQAGESGLAADLALETIARHGAYWDMQELVALHMEEQGELQVALELLETSVHSGRSARGALARARLRQRLEQPGVAVAAIDAWRASAAGSAEHESAEKMLRQLDTSGLVCGRCGGNGTISVTSGRTGEYGSIWTEEQTCPQCSGLGLWDPAIL